MTNHPVHLFDDNNKMLPSAFIPFCSIGQNIRGNRSTKFRLPFCDDFKPVLYEGQHCYQFDIPEKFSKGEDAGIAFILDYNEDKMMNDISNGRNLSKDATIHISTIGRWKNFLRTLTLIAA